MAEARAEPDAVILAASSCNGSDNCRGCERQWPRTGFRRPNLTPRAGSPAHSPVSRPLPGPRGGTEPAAPECPIAAPALECSADRPDRGGAVTTAGSPNRRPQSPVEPRTGSERYAEFGSDLARIQPDIRRLLRPETAERRLAEGRQTPIFPGLRFESFQTCHRCLLLQNAGYMQARPHDDSMQH